MVKRIRIVFFIVTALSASLFNYFNAQNLHKTVTPKFVIFSNAKDGKDYISKTAIFKVKAEYRDLCTASAVNYPGLNTLIQQLGSGSLSRIYPRAQAPERATNESGQKYVDLSLIYQFKYTSNVSLQDVLNKFAALGI